MNVYIYIYTIYHWMTILKSGWMAEIWFHQPANTHSLFSINLSVKPGFTWVAQLIESAHLSKRFTSCKASGDDNFCFATFAKKSVSQRLKDLETWPSQRYQISQNMITYELHKTVGNCFHPFIYVFHPLKKRGGPLNPWPPRRGVSAPSNKPNFSGS